MLTLTLTLTKHEVEKLEKWQIASLTTSVWVHPVTKKQQKSIAPTTIWGTINAQSESQ